MKIINICNRIIEYSFYIIFLLVPLAFASDTFELFEFNKMWLTFGLTLIIAASWFIKMILQRRIFIQRTPLDIPIILFLLSQVISTIFSWDIHISIWGYYSRFNGGLLSIISYIFLYYAFVSNLAAASMVKRLLFVSLISGLAVALWGLPSHFGYDPTCLLFRGTLDVSCWTADFQPKVRIFSTLGQPDWLAAYLAILLPISIAFGIKNSKSEARNPKQNQNSNDKNSKRFEHSDFENSNSFRVSNFGFWIFLLLSALFYLDLLYTGARSGVLATWLSLGFFAIAYFWTQRQQVRKFSILLLLFLSVTFFVGQPFPQLNKFTLDGIKTSLFKPLAVSHPSTPLRTSQPSAKSPASHAGEFGGTDSSKIRKIVWQGAVDTWRHYPIFGTGVETFAFAYYRFRPTEHNLTSEWNFLYNKAHNEFLNYLATTGTVGLGTYILMIGWFIFIFFKYLNPKSEARNPKQYQNSNDQNSKRFEHSDFENSNLSRVSIFEFRILNVALLASFLSILITNFFGFSVVITNIYLFLIPAFVFVLGGMINLKKQFVFPRAESGIITKISLYQWTFIFFIILASAFLLLNLFRFWSADKSYSLGYNLDRAGEYQQAYPHLQSAVAIRDSEPVFKDEIAINNAVLAGALLTQKDTKTSTDTAALANKLGENAIALSNLITSKHPNNVVFWKSRVRVFYSLGQVDSRYLSLALEAIKKASELAPTDANISYNLGVLYGQNGDVKNGIETLEKTIKLKPDYRDAYYALGLFYHDQALDKEGKVVKQEAEKKAVAQMKYILNHISQEDYPVKETLKTWGEK